MSLPQVTAMECRVGCGACCIAISISSAIPNMPGGKPAGVRCVNLDEKNTCRIWGSPEYPEVCRLFRAEPAACGTSFAQAMALLAEMERLTTPD